MPRWTASTRGITVNQARLELTRLAAVTTVGGRNGLKQYGARVRDRVRRSISTPGPPASRPGAPPHRRNSRGSSNSLWASYGYEISGDGLVVDIGSDLEYAAYLEYGTYKMAARPHLRPALQQENAPRVIAKAVLEAQYVYFA